MSSGTCAANRTARSSALTETPEKPARRSRSGRPLGSTSVHVSPRWMTRKRSLDRLSEPARTPPGTRTLAASANSRSCAATERRWWSTVKHTTAPNVDRSHGSAVASPWTTVTDLPNRRRSRSASRGSRSRTVRVVVRGDQRLRARPAPGSQFEHVAAEVEPIEYRGVDGRGHEIAPADGGAEAPVVPVHRPESAPRDASVELIRLSC